MSNSTTASYCGNTNVCCRKFKSNTIMMNFLKFTIINEQYTVLINSLNAEYRIFKSRSNNTPISYRYMNHNLIILSSILSLVKTKLASSNMPSNEVLLLAGNVFKALRNYCLNYKVCEAIFKDDTILIATEYILDKFKNDIYSEVKFLKFLLQFLINLCVNSNNFKYELYRKFKKYVINCLKYNTFSNYGSAFVYNLLLNLPVVVDIDVYEIVLSSITSDTDYEDYLHLLIAYVFLEKNTFCNFYLNLKLPQRLLILKNIKYHFIIGSCTKDISFNLYSEFLNQFKEKSMAIFDIVHINDSVDNAIEICLLLEAIATFSTKSNFLSKMQEDVVFLSNCCNLLKSIQEISKKTENNFSQLRKLSEVTKSNKEIEDHPAFGFKANLVRILGILSYQHQGNQKLLNDWSMIPLLLDCCSLDARNPFITQCAILAVRNLCENNKCNQEVIMSLTKREVLSSEFLENIGFTLDSNENN